MAERILIRGGIALTQDPQLGEIPNANVLVEGDTIVDVGPDLSVGDARVIDATGGVIASYTEWVQNHQRMPWAEARDRAFVLDRLEKTWDLIAGLGPDQWRTNALTTAIENVRRATSSTSTW